MIHGSGSLGIMLTLILKVSIVNDRTIPKSMRHIKESRKKIHICVEQCKRVEIHDECT